MAHTKALLPPAWAVLPSGSALAGRLIDEQRRRGPWISPRGRGRPQLSSLPAHVRMTLWWSPACNAQDADLAWLRSPLAKWPVRGARLHHLRASLVHEALQRVDEGWRHAWSLVRWRLLRERAWVPRRSGQLFWG